MSEDVKTKRMRRPKAEIKVSPIAYERLKIYADSIDSKVDAIVESLIEEYLKREEVNAVLKDKEELIKLKDERAKTQSKLDKLDQRIEELEGSKK